MVVDIMIDCLTRDSTSDFPRSINKFKPDVVIEQ